MKIIPLYPKEIITIEDDECLYCYAYINETEIFCCEECYLAFNEENPEPELNKNETT
jgi:hypothetical protein|tara:strand:+ start:489 stop:659 length:171 start_codon:yes stop_codon:yes gene_type:complete